MAYKFPLAIIIVTIIVGTNNIPENWSKFVSYTLAFLFISWIIAEIKELFSMDK